MESEALLDRRLAFVFLRFTLGLNILMHGAVRLPILSAFAGGMGPVREHKLPGAIRHTEPAR